MSKLKRGRGRPKKPPGEKADTFSISMPGRIRVAVDKVATAQNRSRSAQIVSIIQRDPHVNQVIESASESLGDLD
jgi:hypothetical protein